MFMIKLLNHKDTGKVLRFKDQSVIELFTGKRVLTRAEGWFLRLQYFDFDFEHIPGEANIADAPSRIARKQLDMGFDVENKSQELFTVKQSHWESKKIC